MNFIKKLQNKPRFIRVQILWISVILIMIIIISFWLIHLKSSLGKDQESQEKKAIPSLFGTLKKDLSFFKENLQAGVKKLIENNDKEPELEVQIVK